MLGRVEGIDVVVVSQRLDTAAVDDAAGDKVDAVDTVVAVEVGVARETAWADGAVAEACVRCWGWGLMACTLLPLAYCSLQEA